MFLLLDVSGRLNKNKLFKNKISVNQEIKSYIFMKAKFLNQFQRETHPALTVIVIQ